MLERLCHSDAAFVTLTYHSDRLPILDNPRSSALSATLVPKHTQDWLKRLRKSVSPLKIRYYLVGEYGDTTHRPHYHVALFGFPTCLRGRTDHRRASCCPQCDLIRDTWTHGGVDLGDLTIESAQYLSGYVTKKLDATHKDLHGRYPEFARMSLRPGIGRDAMHDVASVLLDFNLEDAQADVPSALRHGNRLLPLGRYLRRYLRTLVGMDEKISQKAFDEIEKPLLALYEVSISNAQAKTGPVSVKELLLQKDEGKITQMTRRSKLFKKRNTL